MKWTDTHVTFADGYTITREEAMGNLAANLAAILILLPLEILAVIHLILGG